MVSYPYRLKFISSDLIVNNYSGIYEIIPPVPSDSWNDIQVEHAPHFEQPPSPGPQAQFLKLNFFFLI